MADIKVLYVNTDGFNNEHSEAADSIKMLSFKTANKELTDTKLGRLIDGADAADEHIHDARYFRENEHISSSAGAGDAGKPVKTDVDGKLSASLIDIIDLNDELDHGALLGLSDDDHTQYILVAGTRAFTGVQSYNSHPTFNNDLQIVDKKYVDDILLTKEWYPYSALDYVADNTAAPASEVAGDVYVLSHDGGTPHADYDGAAAGDIVRFNGTVWVATTPTAGTRIGVDNEAAVAFYLFGGSTWSPKYEESTTASTGLVKVGFDIRLDSSAAGAGLGFSSGVLSVNVDGSTLEINSDTVRVKADGINDTHIDWGTGANQVNASDIPIEDTGSYFPTDFVNDALQYLAAQIIEQGVEYTVGVGGVTKGDLVYISSANTVVKYGTLTDSEFGIGLALATVAEAGTVKVLSNDTKLLGVLSGATPGDIYYWTGSALSASIPSGGGANVWRVGIAKNATDLHVEVAHVKKNA